MNKAEMKERFLDSITELKIDRTDVIDIQMYFTDWLDDLYSMGEISEKNRDGWSCPEVWISSVPATHSLSGEIYFTDLVIETTRKCNLTCEHCCRGDAENKSMSFETLDRLLRLLSGICTVSLGGGEQGCDQKTFLQISERLLSYGEDISSYFVVLNGSMKYSPEFYDRLTLLQHHSEQCDPGMGGVAISYDTFHTHCMTDQQIAIRERNYQEIEGVKKHTDEDAFKRSQGLINMGRCTFGTKELEPYKAEIYENQVSEITPYLSVDGLLFSDCNLSYKEMTKRSKFFIADVSTLHTGKELLAAIKKYNKRVK